MNNYKKVFTICAAAFLLTANTGCTGNFDEINKKIDGVTEEELKIDNYKTGSSFPRLEALVVPGESPNLYQHQENLLGAVYGRFMMSNVKWKGRNLSEFGMDHNGWINNCFNQITGFYAAWRDIVKDTNSEGINYAWAVILRVSVMHRITDTYGPIPYSKIEGGNLYVEYDSQEKVYKEMLEELNDAIKVLSEYHNANPDSKPMEAFDRVYGGDIGKWIKYANSLKLRMAMRMRYAEPALAQQYAEEAVNHPVGVITSNEDNASYLPTGTNPLYTVTFGWFDTKVCADITAYMNGYDDPRRPMYFNKTSFETNRFDGMRAGTDASGDAYNKYSTPVVTKFDRVMWMTASEVAFLKAEGALANWKMNDGAQNLYEQGIRLSFEQWGASGAETYINDGSKTQADYLDPNQSKESIPAVSTITIKWEDGATEEEKLERIITQKWIALWPLGFEGWCEHRRTGYPKFFPIVRPVQSIYSKMDVANRLPFPPDEYDKNPVNILNAVKDLNGPDNFATKMWWQKK
jgi:hypothetical protein